MQELSKERNQVSGMRSLGLELLQGSEKWDISKRKTKGDREAIWSHWPQKQRPSCKVNPVWSLVRWDILLTTASYFPKCCHTLFIYSSRDITNILSSETWDPEKSGDFPQSHRREAWVDFFLLPWVHLAASCPQSQLVNSIPDTALQRTESPFWDWPHCFFLREVVKNGADEQKRQRKPLSKMIDVSSADTKESSCWYLPAVGSSVCRSLLVTPIK